MCYYIGLQDLAANALIELMNQNNNLRTVTFKALNSYGVAVVQKLMADGREAILLLSRESTYSLIHECSDLFEVRDIGKPNASIALREEVTKEMLIERFCGAIPLEILRAMSTKESLAALNEAA